MISILMPVRDAASTIDEALTSIAGQTRTDWELIAVDDGSTDATPDMLQQWSKREPRLRIIRQEGHGILPALQRAARVASGDLLARMDGDDVSAPERLERQAQLLTDDPSLDVVSCRVAPLASHDSKQSNSGLGVYLDWVNGLRDHEKMMRERFIESPVPHPSVLMRRNAYESAGGYREMGWPEDYDLWLRMFAAGARFGKVDDVLYYWRDTPVRASRTDPRYSLESFQRCKVFHLVHGPLLNNPPMYQWGAGKYGKQILRLLIERNRAPLALVDIDPKKIGNRIPNSADGIPVIAPDALPYAGETVVIAAVGSRASDTARNEIRQAVNANGYIEGKDFWSLA